MQQALDELQRRVAIGMRYAIRLLEAYEGNIDAAEENFKEASIRAYREATGVDRDTAIERLTPFRFGSTAALKALKDGE